ncbi:helix-turn-helix domain-containing protein [Methylovirgula sp. 4M-Z18]|nr:helix-turn-helix domain-containing protein [Methylovirgula sp. 4M-Z18]
MNSDEGPRHSEAIDDHARPLTIAEIANFVRAQREANGWSQETLAEISRLNVRTIQRVEDGQPSSVDTRRALASAFGFSDIDFFSKPMPVPDEVTIRKLVEECRRLQTEREHLQEQLISLSKQAEASQAMLNIVAARDIRWLHVVRTTLVPKQPGRVPFHNATEIALRGYHCSMRHKPILDRVTWSLLAYSEGGLHRGYHAGLIFTGSHFAPGVTIAHRVKGAPTNGAPDASNIWQQPNICFGDYLELAASTEVDGPVSWRRMEFCVRSPEGYISDWVDFSYTFDDEKLHADMQRLCSVGETLLNDGQAAAAVEPLRRSWIISRALFGWGSDEYVRHEAIWKRALEQAALDKLRFREGVDLRVVAGPHEGKSGKVIRIFPHHFHAYLISAGSEEIQAADEQVEAI